MDRRRKRYVPDTNIIIDGILTEKISKGDFPGEEIIIPETVVRKLEKQAANGRETGMTGLEELENLRTMADEDLVSLRFEGEKSKTGKYMDREDREIETLIRELAEEKEATLITSDRIQAMVAKGKGIDIDLQKAEDEKEGFQHLEMMKFLDEDTMSIHLRSNTQPRAKRGKPGDMQLVTLSDRTTSTKELQSYVQEVVEAADIHDDGFVEMDTGGATIIQLGNLRISIANPPFSDAIDMTVTRPITKTVLEDYSYSGLLKDRIQDSQRGILVSGAPGMGKSTLVQAMAEFLQQSGWIVKTMEKPRDLDVSAKISQYTSLNEEMSNTAEILLLSRPDYTIFDEMRKTKDFEVFADMRMAGIGLVGVVHATKGIDALQRLIGRVELGMIPQIVDTVIYVKDGDLQQVYEIDLSVKVPTGIEEGDLARPVVEVSEFETKELKYEIYTFGEEVIVMPVAEEKKKRIWNLAREEIKSRLNRELKFDFRVEVSSDDKITLFVADQDIPKVLGRKGKRIENIEKDLGLSIDVREFEKSNYYHSQIEVKEKENKLILELGQDLSGKGVDIRMDGGKIFTGTVSKEGDIKLNKGSSPAEKIKQGLNKGKKLTAEKI